MGHRVTQLIDLLHCVQTEYAEEVKEEYDQLRTEFYAGLQDIVYLDLPKARERAYQVRFGPYFHCVPLFCCCQAAGARREAAATVSRASMPVYPCHSLCCIAHGLLVNKTRPMPGFVRNLGCV